MLPEALKELAVPAALAAHDEAAIEGGSRDFGETLLWIRAGSIASVCRYLKQELGFERLAGISCIDNHPLEPRFEVLYLLHSLERNERLKLKVELPGDAVVPVDCGVGVPVGCDV